MISSDICGTPAYNSARISHAYILSGKSAYNLAMAVVCSGTGLRPCLTCAHCGKALRRIHPDITVVERFPDKREIVVEQIRAIKKDVVVVPNESEKKAYVISEADTMNTSAQNALLLMLEEPPSHTVFILATETSAALLPTVRSRCVELKAWLEDGCEISDSNAAAMATAFFLAIENGKLDVAEIMFKLEKMDKNDFERFLSTARREVAAKMKKAVQDGAVDSYEYFSLAERLLFKAGEYLELNIGVGHISGMLCAGLLPNK